MSDTLTDAPARRAHTVPGHPASRQHRSQVARWALAHGYPLDRDALAVVVAVRTDATTGVIATRWTTEEVARTIRSSAPLWCSSHGVEFPEDLATTLQTYLRHLSAHRRLAAGSDPVGTLRRAASSHRGSPDGARARHPAGTGRTPAPVLPIS